MMATSSNTPANDDFHKLLLVVKDLAQQLDENRQATTKLKLHADLLKVLSTLPPREQLRTYNFSDTRNGPHVPSSKSTAIDELLVERDELFRENQSLRQENQEMGELLKEYEKGLECITELIRNHAYQGSIRNTQIHREYNEKLNCERRENERLQRAVIDAEARLIKVSGLLRQAHVADHEADRSVDQALLDLQTQNRGLRQALGLPVDSMIDLEKELVFTVDEEHRGQMS